MCMYLNPIPYIRLARTRDSTRHKGTKASTQIEYASSNLRKSLFHTLLSEPSKPHHPPAPTSASSSPAEAEAIPSPSDSPPTPASDYGGVPQAHGDTACLRAHGYEGSVRRWFRCRRSCVGWFGRCWASFLFRRLVGMGGSMLVGGGVIGAGGGGGGGGRRRECRG